MWMICDNMRGFMASRPPLVLFMLCLGIFAFVLLTVGYVVKVNDIRNPDEKDWNDFLAGFKNVQFCMVSDDSDAANATDDESHLGSKNYKEVISDVHSKLKGETEQTTQNPSSSDDIVMVSVPLWVEVKPTLDFVSIPHNVTHLSTSMSGRQMGMEGENANTEFNVTFTLPYPWNASLCHSHTQCKVIHIQTCVKLQAPQKLFPHSRKPSVGQCETANGTGGVENHFKMVSKRKSAVRPIDIVCNSMPSFTMKHESDPSLAIMLTLQDKSAINLHLMHTTYFLFVMVITMMCYGLVKGRPATVKVKNNVQYTEVSTQV
ncbi:transmembrane protein 248-like [Mercenaria mercenaria]|uniref:transmembrane protein 248-like n=1 Tax=Mercenaria mercenaria TaxID=6596 RepID=UPI00234F2E45|nr:transmembrane protein 248-like [Mercenaria mercenaria]